MPLNTEDRIYIEQRIQNDAKSPLVAYLLWFFFGAFGVHRFYLGYVGTGLIMAVLTIIGMVTAAAGVGLLLLLLVGLIWLWDAVSIPGKVERHKNGMRSRLERHIGG